MVTKTKKNKKNKEIESKVKKKKKKWIIGTTVSQPTSIYRIYITNVAIIWSPMHYVQLYVSLRFDKHYFLHFHTG
jgi:hypothetical protein